MIGNGAGPDAVAAAFEAPVNDLLDGKINAKDSAANGTTQENRFYVPKDIKPKRQRRTKKKRDGCRWVRNDGGRHAAGYDNAGDRGGCVPRAIAIASGLPYREVLDALTLATSRYVKRFPRSWIARWIKRSRHGRGWDPAQGCYDEIYGTYLESIGWQYAPVEGRLRLRADEVPSGRVIIRVHRHLVAVIDGVIHDTYDSGAAGHRPVIGYWRAP